MPKKKWFVNVIALVIGCASLCADEYVHFEHFFNRPFSEGVAEVGAVPVFTDFSNNQIEEIFAEFHRGKVLDEMSHALTTWAPDFLASDSAAAWKGCNYRFGIFQSGEATHKKTRLIQGVNCKMSLEFCDWIMENHGADLMPELSRLIHRLTQLDQVCHKIFLEKVEEIAETHPQINQIFYSYKGKKRLPISLRLIRFEASDRFTMPLHFDISLMSLVFPSDDPPLDECLLIAPADGSFTIEKLKRPLRPSLENQRAALMISGTMLGDLDIPILPTPHGVLPHNRDFRYVIVACLHIPNLDTSKQSFLLPTLHETPPHLRRPCEVREVSSLDQIKLEEVSTGALVLIDIGGTLLQHKSALSYKENQSWVEKWCKENAPHLSSDEMILSIKNDNDSWVLTDPDWPTFVQKAKERGVNVVAFSKRVPIPAVRQNRLTRIKSLCLELSSDLSLRKSPHFLYEQGVIETDMNLKGHCLKEILTSLKPMPSQIVFIENEREQIDSVEATCREFNIPCLSFHYTGAQTPDFDPELADQELRRSLDHFK